MLEVELSAEKSLERVHSHAQAQLNPYGPESRDLISFPAIIIFDCT